MRVQLVVSEAQQSMIEALRKQMGVATVKEVFNNALTLLNWAVRQRQEGSAICAINESKNVYKELQLPALDFCTYQPAEIIPAKTEQTISVPMIPNGNLAPEMGERAARAATTVKRTSAGQRS
jgi:hypothetical protein